MNLSFRRAAVRGATLLAVLFTFLALPVAVAQPLRVPVGSRARVELPPSLARVLKEAARLDDADRGAEAIQLLRCALAALPKNAPPTHRARLSVALADVHFSEAVRAGKARWDEASRHYEAAYALYKDYQRGRAMMCLQRNGEGYFERGDLEKAVPYFERMIPLCRALGSRNNEGWACFYLGVIRVARLERESAVTLLEAAANRWHTDESLTNELFALQLAMGVYEGLRDLDSALRIAQRMLVVSRRAKEELIEIQVTSHISVLSASRYDIVTADRYAAMARKLVDQLGVSELAESGEREKAVRQQRMMRGIVLADTGTVALAKSDLAAALKAFDEALPLLRDAGEKDAEVQVLNNLGQFYAALGDADVALRYFERALPLAEKGPNPLITGLVYGNIGMVRAATGAWNPALDAYDKGLKIFRALRYPWGEGMMLSNIGQVNLARANYPAALNYFGQARALGRRVKDPFIEAMALANAGAVHFARAEWARAGAAWAEALAIQERLGEPRARAMTCQNLMVLWSDPRNPARDRALAIWYGKRAVNIYQSLRQNLRALESGLQQGYTNRVEPIYRALADLLIAEGRLPEAQQVLDLLKQQEYFAFVRRAPGEGDAVDGRADLTAAEVEAEKKYRAASEKAVRVAREYDALLKKKPRTAEEEKRLDVLYKDLVDANAAFQRFLAGLEKEFAGDRAAANRLETVKDAEALTATLAKLDAQTGERTAAVYTLVGEKAVRFLVITGGAQVARVREVPAAELAKKVFAFRAALRNPVLNPLPLAKELYELVYAPVAKDLADAGARNVLWSLDGVLRYAPLAALSPDGKTYLAEGAARHTIFTPATLSRLVNAPGAGGWRALAVGVSRESEVEGVRFAALAGAKEEVDGVNGILPGRVLLDADFSEASLVRALRDGYPLVHVATHFYFRPGDEGRSFLLLGDGSALPLARLRDLPATLFSGVELLTLSACDTATGSRSGPDGAANGAEFESFGLLAQRKGAEAVLATLWPVADASTSALMRAFYRARKENPTAPKSEALRIAQLALLHGNAPASADTAPKGVTPGVTPDTAPPFPRDPSRPCAHPYYWAGFVLIGNYR